MKHLLNITDNSLNRRKFLQLGMIGLASLALPDRALSAINNLSQAKKKLSFYNTHTGEKLKIVYWADGQYIKESLRSINWILRDHRSSEMCTIDTGLLDLLHSLQKNRSNPNTIHIVSGYRTPKTNTMLQKNSTNVAKKSLHMIGKAIDVRIPGFELKKLHSTAVKLKKGGVGFYPQSDFIHIDVGRVRTWG